MYTITNPLFIKHLEWDVVPKGTAITLSCPKQNSKIQYTNETTGYPAGGDGSDAIAVRSFPDVKEKGPPLFAQLEQRTAEVFTKRRQLLSGSPVGRHNRQDPARFHRRQSCPGHHLRAGA